MKRKRLSLTEASREAYRLRIVGDYHALSREQLDALDTLLAQTSWVPAMLRKAATSHYGSRAISTRERRYHFHQALLRAASRWAPSHGPDSKFSSANVHARTAFKLREEGRSLEGADHLDVAADAYETAGDYRSAMRASDMAAYWRRHP